MIAVETRRRFNFILLVAHHLAEGRLVLGSDRVFHVKLVLHLVYG